MKFISKILPLTLVLLIAFAQVQAQQNMDNNRLNRDINIMENILSELFQVKSSSSSQRSRLVMAFGSRSEEVRGTYLPGYGVIFQISKPYANILITSTDEEEEEHTVVFQYSDSGEEEEEVNAESVKNRIVDFLKDYGSTIGQLSSDEHVMVIYGGGPDNRNTPVNIFNSSGMKSAKSTGTDLPVISVSAQMADLAAYRSGDLNVQKFRNRLSISETERNNTEDKDLRIMSKIFETAYEDNEDGFEVRGSVDYLKLDNFGALFFFEARKGTNYAISDIQIRSVSDSNNAQRVRALVETRQALEEQQKAAEQQREELRKNAATAFETFKNELKEYLVDYGRTLSSVDSNQYILLSINLNVSVDEIPERIDLQIAKSVLDQMDRGDIDREQAISRVSIREY